MEKYREVVFNSWCIFTIQCLLPSKQWNNFTYHRTRNWNIGHKINGGGLSQRCCGTSWVTYATWLDHCHWCDFATGSAVNMSNEFTCVAHPHSLWRHSNGSMDRRRSWNIQEMRFAEKYLYKILIIHALNGNTNNQPISALFIIHADGTVEEEAQCTILLWNGWWVGGPDCVIVGGIYKLLGFRTSKGIPQRLLNDVKQPDPVKESHLHHQSQCRSPSLGKWTGQTQKR